MEIQKTVTASRLNDLVRKLRSNGFSMEKFRGGDFSSHRSLSNLNDKVRVVDETKKFNFLLNFKKFILNFKKRSL